MRSRSANPECDYYHVPYTSNSTCGLLRTSVGQLDASMRDPSAQLNYVEEVSTSGNQRARQRAARDVGSCVMQRARGRC